MGGKPLLQSPRDALKRVQTSLLDKCGLSIKVLQKTMHLPASPTMFASVAYNKLYQTTKSM